MPSSNVEVGTINNIECTNGPCHGHVRDISRLLVSHSLSVPVQRKWLVYFCLPPGGSDVREEPSLVISEYELELTD